jgi:tRNA-specific 2-thiouridylase
VAAALLKEKGHELIGITMNLACSSKAADRGCCSLDAAQDAKKVADQLGFPHYTLNYKDDFKRAVIDDFIAEYRAGRTPNPCIRCNQLIKFDLLLKKARELGAEFIATGHYARIKDSKLLKGKDAKKDQSYVLYRLTQEQLAHTLFPLGEMTKEEVREKARSLGLKVAEKKESQEICFVEGDDYGKFLRESAPELVKPGKIVDLAGQMVGEHQGIVFYTIGQRKGLGHHQGKPMYVVALDPEKNQVVIGEDQDLFKSELLAEAVTFVSGKWPSGELDITAKIRYNSKEVKARLEIREQKVESRAQVVFAEPQRAVTPGQAVVFYQGEEVLGGGIISR